MKKREFLKTGGLLLTGAILSGFGVSCKPKGAIIQDPVVPENKAPMKAEEKGTALFTLPALEYAVDALVPVIDKMTMEIHHGKHHAGYVNNLNKALESNKLLALPTVEAICAAVQNIDVDLSVRNNAGGHYNHSLYWRTIGPKAKIEQAQPTGALAAAINSTFGSFENFKTKFADAAMSRFGSGWAWLTLNKQKQLTISSTPNQDNPLMVNCVEVSGVPLLGIDVWEHAYYLNYQNKRKDYVLGFLELVRWERVNANFEAANK